MADKKNFRETVAEEMIRHLEAGTAPWQKPWVPGAYNASPFNPTTGKPYRGINSYWLELSGYSDPRWMTYKQASDFDAQVNKGEKSTQIEYWQWTKELPLLDQDGKPVRDAEGKAQKQSVRLERPKVFYANVFNGDQITGLEPYKAPELKFEPVVEAELILENSGVAIHHDQNDRAYYHRLTDDIHMPPAGAFKSGYEYYATALHEVGHATGAAHRMVRDKGPFGS
uniref:ArdC family protein n=1 Tax=Kiloniella laminariae TaxID=454162 RepID=UPI00037D0B02